MGQLEINLRDLYRVVRKRKWLIIVAPIFMGLATLTLNEPPRPVYAAEALLRITRSNTLAGLMTELVSYSTYDNMATQIMIVTSRTVLEEVAYTLNLAKRGEDPQPGIDYLRARVSVEQRGTSDVLSIKAKAPSPDQAMAIANTTAEVYIHTCSAEKDKRLNDTIQFIQKRLKETSDGLRGAEEALGNFQRANAAILYRGPLLSADAQEKEHQYRQKIADARNALSALDQMQQKKDYDSFTQSYIPTDDAGVRSLGDEVTRRLGVLVDLRTKRAQLLTYQREQAPEAVALQGQINAEERRLEAPVSTLRRRLGTIVSDYEQLLNSLIRQRSELLRQPELTSQLVSMQNVVKEKQELTSTLRKQLQDVEVQQRERVEEISFVERAKTAAAEAQRSAYYTAVIGVLIGLLLGGVFAFVLESMDTSIGTIEDVERYIKSNVLGIIPHLETEDVLLRLKREHFPSNTTEEDLHKFARLTTHFDSKSVASESYRTLRTNLGSIMARTNKKVILISSSVIQEGKTTSCANLAVAFAQAGRKTLLIDGDIRRPAVDKIFGVEKIPGLSDFLLGSHDLKDCTRAIGDFILGKFGLNASQVTPGLEYLHVIPAGTSVDNPTGILNSPAMDKLLLEVRQDFDVVVMDVSPILPVADAFILAPKVDGVILTYQIGRVARDVLRRSKLRVESVGGTIWGIIMNDIQAEIDYRQGDFQYYHDQYPPRALKEKRSAAARIKDKLAGVFSAKPARKQRGKTSGPSAMPPPGSSSQSPTSASGNQQLRDIMSLTDDK